MRLFFACDFSSRAVFRRSAIDLQPIAKRSPTFAQNLAQKSRPKKIPPPKTGNGTLTE
jgi:hypothetical protein